MGVYAITHDESGKAYIGSSVDIGARWYNHRAALRGGRHHSHLLQAAWTGHGEDTFSFQILERVESLTDLRLREQAWLDQCRTYESANGYNVATGTIGRGWKPTPEQCARLSALARARGKSPAWRAAMAARVMSPAHLEQVAAMGRARAGKKAKASTRRKISDAQRGTAAHSAILNEARVVEIMWRLAVGDRVSAIARDYGVHDATVADIKHGRSWLHVTGLV
jgi:group I intron endonuclease